MLKQLFVICFSLFTAGYSFASSTTSAPNNQLTSTPSTPEPDQQTITHIVAFHYKPTVTQQQKDEIARRFLALKHEAKRNGDNYIVSISGGNSNSVEGLNKGFEQVFIVTFTRKSDFEYYIGRPLYSPYDPSHDKFKKFVQPFLSVDKNGKINGVMVFDVANPN